MIKKDASNGNTNKNINNDKKKKIYSEAEINEMMRNAPIYEAKERNKPSPKLVINDRKDLILTIELVPKTSFYNNLRDVVSTETWDKLRKQTYSKYKVTCGICGVKDVTLDCHEIWEYDEDNLIQKLVGLIAICKSCHMIKHHGYANLLAHQGKLNIEDLIAHFMKVNNCTRKEYASHKRHAFQEWTERSSKDWTVDLGEYKQYVNK